jgi:hypothetical protein
MELQKGKEDYYYQPYTKNDNRIIFNSNLSPSTERLLESAKYLSFEHSFKLTKKIKKKNIDSEKTKYCEQRNLSPLKSRYHQSLERKNDNT